MVRGLGDLWRSLDVVGLLEQPWWLAVRKKRSGRVWKWVSSDAWSPKPQLCSCSASVRCLDLGHEHVMVLRLWAVSTKNRNGPVWSAALMSQAWEVYFSPSANSFLSFGSVAASVYIKETSVKIKTLSKALTPWGGKHKSCLSFL